VRQGGVTPEETGASWQMGRELDGSFWAKGSSVGGQRRHKTGGRKIIGGMGTVTIKENGPSRKKAVKQKPAGKKGNREAEIGNTKKNHTLCR